MDAFLLSRALLHFDNAPTDLPHDLSATAITADGSMWLASDERQTIERLIPIAPYVFGEHQSFPIRDFLQLYNTGSEVDIEGMDYADHYVWFTGSHSLKRTKAKGKHERKNTALEDLYQPYQQKRRTSASIARGRRQQRQRKFSVSDR